MKFIAQLVTSRKLERGVTKFAASQINAESHAREWLEHSGEPGDKFDILEVRAVSVSSVSCAGSYDDKLIFTHPAGIPEIQK